MRWLLVLCYVLVISVLSSIPAHHYPEASFWEHDKILHFLEFFGLGALVMHAWQRLWWSWLAAGLFGVLDEFHQIFVPGRDASLLDGVADVTGALAGVTAYLFLVRLFRKVLGEARLKKGIVRDEDIVD